MLVKVAGGYKIKSHKTGKMYPKVYGLAEEAQARIDQMEHFSKSVQLISLDEAWQQFSLSKSRTHGARDKKKREKGKFFNRYEKMKSRMSEGSAFSKVKLGK